MDTLKAIASRRSYGRLTMPAPGDEHLRLILEAAAAAPDHGELKPWRFTVLTGESLDRFGSVLEEAYVKRCTDQGVEPVPARATKERTKLGRAPMVLIVSAVRQVSDAIPWGDQRDAVVAAAQNALLAAHALGYGSMWRTGDICHDAVVKHALGLTDDDDIVGFLYLGTPREVKPPHEIDLAGMMLEYR
jgi:nitroreductase